MNEDVKPLGALIVDEIRLAFGRVVRGDGVSLHEAEVIDNYGSDEERIAARALDTEQRWEDVPDHVIESHHDALCFVDPKGFRYYLPAYMVWALRNFRTSDSFSVDHPIYSLKLWERGRFRDWELERFRVFDNEQAKAICHFLRFMAEQVDFVDSGQARAALEGYWGTF